MGVLSLQPLAGQEVRGLKYLPLEQLESEFPGIRRLPYSLRILLESAARGHLNDKLGREHLERLAGWRPHADRDVEVSFFVNRILVPDSTGIPLLADLAAMRSAAARQGRNPKAIEPGIRVDLVVDHSVQIDVHGRPDALALNTELEFERNQERFRFIKWSDAAFDKLRVVPPGNGICHQINLEQLAGVAWVTDGVAHPDTLLGCDSHTTMVNGMGVIGWGVGGIEAESAMLGQPVTMLLPDVIGVHLHGILPVGVTTTDLVLTVTERLRKVGVVGKFVEFFGKGAVRLSVPERATLANMAPEYGATIGFFPVDERTLDYLRDTGRGEGSVALVRDYYHAQGMFGVPGPGQIDFSQVVEIDLAGIVPSIAGPRRPQDRIALSEAGRHFRQLLAAPVSEGGYGRDVGTAAQNNDGDVVLAAITSCTNTSNPQVMIAAGLLARNALRVGLQVDPKIKTSFSPGSRSVAAYMENLGLLAPLAALGFEVAAFGCGTCIGNSGPLDPELERQLAESGAVVAAVLSGNRNFEARIHPAIKANFLASPPLVVAYAIAGSVGRNLETEPLQGDVLLADIWPDAKEIADLTAIAARMGAAAGTDDRSRWDRIEITESAVYDWAPSTYIKEPPFFPPGKPASALTEITGARALLILGDSVTTDHISPGGAIKPTSDAGKWLIDAGIAKSDFNTFAARRGNHEIMMRGTFGNVRLRNRMAPGTEGGFTCHQPSGETMSVFDAAMRYREERVPVVVFAGREYGTGSSRDWAAKGPALLGVRAIVAQSFERIHRSNLVGLGILPLRFDPQDSSDSLGLAGTETFDLLFPNEFSIGGRALLRIARTDGRSQEIGLRLCVETVTEMEYLANGGIMPQVLSMTLEADASLNPSST
ncbi:aconitate hydratase AcnA [Paracoccus sp. DMF-8]|uniref:aconitate hydratase AcnA n=1 Tax=Paracoccus sp. DMF-8 TaxID=3019445 RepID=UPI0023E863FE|nr:aconitate hydratase AcnA [Paracoccus sp. DMF-8]MDF3606688.1 aconitate hydratase AcnA [Paracoccus sp. DMF-8]